MVNNIVLQNKVCTQVVSPKFEKKKTRVQATDVTPQDKLDRIYRSQGLVGKAFDKIQGWLGLGFSKKKLKSEIESGNLENIDKKLDKYYDQQKNTTELSLDLATGVFAASAFRLAKKINTYSHLYVKHLGFEKYSKLIGLGASALIGLVTKPILKGLNNIGTKKEDRKRERTFWRDAATGLIDGAAAPLMYMHKLGIFAAAGVNSLSRYVFNKKADKENGLKNQISTGWLAKGTAVGLAGLSAFAFHKRIDVLEKAIEKSKLNVQDIQRFETKAPLSELIDLTKTNVKDKKTQSELIDCTRKGFFSDFYLKISKPFRKKKADGATVGDAVELGAKPLKRVVCKQDLLKEQEMMNIMREIEQYNIFYPKMIQTLPSNVGALKDLMGGDAALGEIFVKAEDVAKEKNWFKRKGKKFLQKRQEHLVDNGFKTVNDFLNSYKSSCPASRTVEEAQTYIAETYGKRFTVLGDKPLGVGTVAETFLAKDNETGNEVVIKVVKKWVNEDKLKSDKTKMLDAIERVKEQLSPDEYQYQKRLVNELYEAWSKELNLSLEADAANTLGKFAQHYNTVAPIDVKNNIFVMEKANGVQFDKFAEFLEENNIQLTMDEAMDLLRKYMQVFFEQLLSVPKKGEKVMHADPHAGNIFIDITNKSKPFTFIDTGNVMRFTPEEAIQNVTSHIDYLIGNSKSIAQKLLKGASLPEGMSEEKAVEMLSKHLDETFFSGKYKIRTSDPFSAINNESMDFMKKNKVILNSNNTNMVKAELTYLMNLVSISKIAKNVDLTSQINEAQQEEQLKLMFKQIGESIWNGAINNKKCTREEVMSRIKFMKENPEQFFTSLYTYIPPKAFEKAGDVPPPKM